MLCTSRVFNRSLSPIHSVVSSTETCLRQTRPTAVSQRPLSCRFTRHPTLAVQKLPILACKGKRGASLSTQHGSLKLGKQGGKTPGTLGLQRGQRQIRNYAVSDDVSEDNPIKTEDDLIRTEDYPIKTEDEIVNEVVQVPKNLAEDFNMRFLACFTSDYTDAINMQCVATGLFMFLTCLAPAISFGALLSTLTGGSIGAVEMLVGTSVSGTLYAMLSGQPLTIIGSTGPIVTFTGILYAISAPFGIPFLPFYSWVGIWSAAILFVCALTSASNSIKYITRFTDEIFSALIAVIFVHQAITFLVTKNLLNPSVDPATSLLSVVIAIITYTIARRCSGAKACRWGVQRVRDVLGDFGPLIAVIAGGAFACMVFPDIAIQTLHIPSSFTTTTGRPWLVPLFDPQPFAFYLYTLALSAMGVILMFLDQNITTRIVNSPDNKLKKSPGFHLDMLVLSVLIGIQSIFGLPWMVAATAPSIIHIRALQEIEKDPITGREEIVHVHEQRLTGVIANCLVGCSFFCLKLLSYIPIAALSGLFLHFGLQTAKGNEFVERLELLLTDPSKRKAFIPDYLKGVHTKSWMIFTCIQAAAFIVLWKVMESSKYGVAFPLVILALVPLRLMFPNMFEPKELKRIDPMPEM